MNELTLALAGSAVLAASHALSPVLNRLPERYHTPLASFSAGVGLTYVMLYLLYELVTSGAPKVHQLLPIGPDPVATICLILLAAVAVNYTVEIQLQKTHERWDDQIGYGVLFLTYNVLAGAGLVEEARWGVLNLGFYVAALGLHMLFNDMFLHHVYPGAHTLWWRLSLALAPLVGTAAIVVFPVSEGLLYVILAYIAGGTIINVLRFELPGMPTFRPIAFASGIILYSALIIATWRL